MPKKKSLKTNKVITAVYKTIDDEWFRYSISSVYSYVSYILLPEGIDFPDPLNKIKVAHQGIDHALTALNQDYVVHMKPEDVWPKVSWLNLMKMIKIAPHITDFKMRCFWFYKVWNYCCPETRSIVQRWPVGCDYFDYQGEEIFVHNYRYLIEDIDKKLPYLRKVEGKSKLRPKWKQDIWGKFKQNPAEATGKGLHPFDKDLFKNYIVYSGEWPNAITQHKFFKENL